VAGRRLSVREVDDVPEDAADRRADEVDDAETRRCHARKPVCRRARWRRGGEQICLN
jgi:hypothetical protein